MRRQVGRHARSAARAKGVKGAGSVWHGALGAVLLVLGLGLFLYPTVSSLMAQHEVEQALDAWGAGTAGEDAAGSADASVDEGSDSADGQGDGQTFRAKDGDATYDQLLAYNDAVRAGTGDAVNDPFAFSGDDLAAWGLPDGIIGSLTIPALGETIPLYLGATEANMLAGAGVIAGTSMPTGGAGNNCVIAAHRGAVGGLTMFRDIEKLQVGDTLTIRTPWDELTYRVAETQIITPDDAQALAPQEGRDLVTLLTCHPYGYNYQRILTICERVPNTEAQPDRGVVADAVEQFWPGWSDTSPLLTAESALKLAGVGILLLLGAFLLIDGIRRRLSRQ